MEEIIRREVARKLAEVQLTENYLTPAELQALRAEVIAEMNGEVVHDSILSNPEILYRNIGHCDG